ncbi:sensor histidine kinase [Roseateles amylovorans]|uniref:histidine kinase n=1 Tax=Roseateles amylovorans TaxID=2978473 RepID=A0ABY6AUN6_9BURK|nr:ATP-binding protein [Roseateles amylovorans]UXH76495.1 ATP-binding protein [Roseateles amylovorans]
MKISHKARIAAVLMFGAMLLIAASIAWANAQVSMAVEQRRHSAEIASALNDMRMVSFEYLLNRRERARLQEKAVWQRLEGLLSQAIDGDDTTAKTLASLRANVEASHNLFVEVDATQAAGTPNNDIQRRFETQLSNRLLIIQQRSLVDAAQMIEDAGVRIDDTQRRVVIVTASGLILMALITAAAVWIFRRDVLNPIAQLEHATRELAAGNWSFELNVTTADELGEMARRFDAMTRALRESFSRIELSNRELVSLNSELESFSYSVSHDLRSPLRSMDGFSLALLEDYGDKLDDEARDSLQRIRGASQRMGRLIDELLGLARVTRAELRIQDVDISAMARDIAADLTRTQPQRQVRWEIEDGIRVQADRELIHIALQNLLDNAWKFTGKTADAVIRVGQRVEGGDRICFVSDNGAGFDMAYADRLFGAFQRLHHESDFPGTGVGLAIVQRVLRRHGWPLWAKAALGTGASFFFRIQEHIDERREQSHPAG